MFAAFLKFPWFERQSLGMGRLKEASAAVTIRYQSTESLKAAIIMAHRELYHAHFGTPLDLLTEGMYLPLVDRAKEFFGSPFTLCRCPPLGGGDINLTEKVRQSLHSRQWAPESGGTDLTFLAPANGRYFSIEFAFHPNSDKFSHVHFRFEPSYLSPELIDTTLVFLKETALALQVDFGYIHDALDEAVQNTTDPNKYRSLTGREPADPEALNDRPGRTAQLEESVVSCRWISLFGQDLAMRIGVELLQSAPCDVEQLDRGLFWLRLADSPADYDTAEFRETQAAVRRHLGLDRLLSEKQWEPIERLPSNSYMAIAGDDPPDEVDVTEEVVLSEASEEELPSSPVLPWGSLYDGTSYGFPGELEFYREQARQAAGRVLEVGCGTVTIAVAETGVPVIAIDPSATTIVEMQERLDVASDGVRERTTLLLGDLPNDLVSQRAPFAATFIPYRGINRLVEQGKLRSVLEYIHSCMRPGGILAFNTFYPQPERWTSSDCPTIPQLSHVGLNQATNTRFLVYDAIDVDVVGQKLSVTRRFDELATTGEVVKQRYLFFDLRYFFPTELLYLLEICGFEVSIFGGFEQKRLKRPDQEMVFVGRRK